LQNMGNVRGLVGLGFVSTLLAHQQPKNRIPTTQIVQGWVFTNALSWEGHDGAGSWGPVPPNTWTLDEPNQGYPDPSDIVIAPTKGNRLWNKQLFIACAGGDCIEAVDLDKLVVDTPKSRYDEGDPNVDDLTISRHFITARIPTQAIPRRLALSGDGKTLVVSNYLADSLTVIDVATKKVVRHIPLRGPKPDAARRGEILFNSGKMTFHGQFTCASCHPNGGSDGLSWDLTRDGIGNFKRTKSLLGVKDTAPYGWHGSSSTLADRIAGTLRTLHRHEPTDAEVADLAAYLRTLPPPRPLPQKAADKPAITRGRGLFQGKGQCAVCHRRAALDDGKLHDVGTRGTGDTQDRFDTPALLGVARTAPYLHDGRAKTLEEVFSKYNAKKRHGAAHRLTKRELADLLVYLKSL
jgi:YVTN family beta-propeller protein